MFIPRPAPVEHQLLSAELPVPLSTFSHFSCSQVLPFSFCRLSTSLLPSCFVSVDYSVSPDVFSYQHLFPVTPVSARQLFETYVISKINSYFTYVPDSLIVLFPCRFLTQAGNNHCCSALSLVPFLASVWGKFSIKKELLWKHKIPISNLCELYFSFNHITCRQLPTDFTLTEKVHTVIVCQFSSWKHELN